MPPALPLLIPGVQAAESHFLPDGHLHGTSHLLTDISGMNGNFSVILFPVKIPFPTTVS